MDPTGDMFGGFIGERTDVPTMAVVITGDITDLIIVPTITGLIVGTCVEFIDVHIEGDIIDALGSALWRPVLPNRNLKPTS